MNFQLHIGIDYSGAKTSSSRLPGLQVYCDISGHTDRLSPAGSAGKSRNWSREQIASWLIETARSGKRFIAGIDHGFSFPIDYFQRYQIGTWKHFLKDFAFHWPTNLPGVSIDSLRKQNDTPPDRTGRNNELRLTEKWTSSAKSVFQFDVQGSVAKSTHAGLPWLWQIKSEIGELVHFWPFDGWAISPGKNVLAEVYPSIFRNRFLRRERTVDEQDAYATAQWLREIDCQGFLERYLDPPLSASERSQASLEGWILGVM